MLPPFPVSSVRQQAGRAEHGKALAWRCEINFQAVSTIAIADLPAAGARSTMLFYASAAAMCISGESIAANGDLCDVLSNTRESSYG
jgi:hypothetical protein